MVIGLFGGIIHSLFAQFEHDYSPLKFEGEIPAHFSAYLQGNFQPLPEQIDIEFDEEIESEFGNISQYVLSQSMRSGDVYLNPLINDYLSRLLDYLLREEPELRSQLHIYGTKILQPNAYSWTDGTIFVNLALFTILENEAQLAYILSHEIAHFREQHAMRSYVRKKELSQVASKENTDQLFQLLRFSRKQELEADLLGFKLFQQTDYAHSEALAALRALEKAESYIPEFNAMHLDSLFQVNDMALQSSYAFQANKGEINPIDKEAEHDPFATHPSIRDRVMTIKAILDNSPQTSEGLHFLFPKEDFELLKTTALFELTEKAYMRGKFAAALYMSLQLAQRYPENQFLMETAGKVLYWLSYFEKKDELNKVLPAKVESPEDSYEEFVYALHKFSRNKFSKIGQMFLEDKHQQFTTSEELLIYRAKMYELMDMDSSKLYSMYLQKFPEGKHKLHVKAKLN